MNLSLPARRRVATAVVLVALSASGLAPAQAEGPGYGGTADGLDIRWEAQGSSPGAIPAVLTSSSGGGRAFAAHIRAADPPRIQQDVLDLTVRGIGFRAKSAVTVRLGGNSSLVVRADTAGSLAVAIDGSQLEGTDPGVSIMALGRNPAGTQVVLLGSVPPAPGGTGPMALIPWVLLAVVLAGLARWTARPRPVSQPVGRHQANGKNSRRRRIQE
jgi:hypothetical protein